MGRLFSWRTACQVGVCWCRYVIAKPGRRCDESLKASSLTRQRITDYSTTLLNMRKQHRRAKARIYDQLARIGRALGSRSRFELLEMLSQGELSVEILARRSGLSIANASQHLRVLREAGLVEAGRAASSSITGSPPLRSSRSSRASGASGKSSSPKSIGWFDRILAMTVISKPSAETSSWNA
jgi:DNA-binding transcriptional ArsR family regulator